MNQKKNKSNARAKEYTNIIYKTMSLDPPFTDVLIVQSKGRQSALASLLYPQNLGLEPRG